jgi:hypothetical protein
MLEPYWNNRVEIVAKGEYNALLCFIVVLLDLLVVSTNMHIMYVINNMPGCTYNNEFALLGGFK